jgi:hypothetical protein
MLIEGPARSADFVALYLDRAMVKSSACVAILFAIVTGAASAASPLLRIEQLRVVTSLEGPQPSVVLKFDVLNDSPSRLTDVVIRVSFVESDLDEIDEIPAKVVAGPVTIRFRETLEAGYVLSYEMLFRNFSPECECSPRVEILSARSLPE